MILSMNHVPEYKLQSQITIFPFYVLDLNKQGKKRIADIEQISVNHARHITFYRKCLNGFTICEFTAPTLYI